jgi:hypothetical protein
MYPNLAGYGKYSWSNASFALYSAIDMSKRSLEAIAADLDAKWYAEQGNEGSHLSRVAPFPIHTSLIDILEAHAGLEKVVPGQSEEQHGALDLEWYPTAFVVVTAEVLDERGLLFVYVDDEVEDEGGDDEVNQDETTQFPIDKFYFKQKDANVMLSTLIYDDDSAARMKEIYGY